MADFFSPVEEEAVSRTEQDEDEERIAEKARRRTGNRSHVFPVVRERAVTREMISLWLMRLASIMQITPSLLPKH